MLGTSGNIKAKKREYSIQPSGTSWYSKTGKIPKINYHVWDEIRIKADYLSKLGVRIDNKTRSSKSNVAKLEEAKTTKVKR